MLIVFDIGGTNTRIASSTDGKTLAEIVKYPTPQNFSEGVRQITETAKKLAGDTPITAMAGGLPGPMDSKHTQILNAPNLPDWNNKPLKHELEQDLATRVYLENDTAMWGLGEAHAGAGKGKDIVVYITVSTGVGGTRIVRGKIDKSAYGFEIGHQTIDPNGPQCGCGAFGHLEAHVGGNALEKRYGKKPKEIAAQEKEIWERAIESLAVGLLNTCVFWSPQAIILGGSMMRDIPVEKVVQYMQTQNRIYPELPEILNSALGDSGGLIGSLYYLSTIAPSNTPELPS